jgi:xylulokinase
MKKSYILGIDSSTSATKTMLFDAQGQIVAQSAHSYPVYTERSGWMEQDANDWWHALKTGCQEVCSRSGINLSRIAALGLTHQRFTFVAVDRQFQPLRKAILWNDTRCSAEAEYAEHHIGSSEIFRRTGYPPAHWTLYNILWLKNHEPDTYSAMHRALLVQDYLVHKLTGNLVMPQGSGAMTGALDIEQPHQWAMDIIRLLDLREDIWVPTIIPSGSIAGTVTESASQATGLPPGLPVIAAGGDQPCGILGAGVIEPGVLGINGGTSCTNELLSPALPKRAKADYHIEISPTGNYIVENCIPSGGSALMNWYKQHFGNRELIATERTGRSVWEILHEVADRAPVGNDGMMIVPYFQGANGPYWDQTARGIVFGIRAEHGRAHLLRGLIEGLAYESRRETELMEAGIGMPSTRIAMYGGSARSDLWNQTFADILNRPVSVPETEETTALGAAISAAVACGLHSSFREAVSEMVRIRKHYTPIQSHVQRYERLYREVYVKLYDRLQNLSSLTAEIAQKV